MKSIVLAMLPAMAAAGPRFEPAPEAFDVPHIYSGGWEHFVGGGVAVFDCNGDARPDIAAAGGSEPLRLFVNAGGATIRFAAAELPGPRGTTGVYPLDADGDGALDLAVLRAGPNSLLKGNGACGFADATEDWGLRAGEAWSTAFAATWEQGRDRPTLAIGNYVDRADPEGPFGACDDNEVYRPGSDGYGAPEILSPGWCALSMLISDWRREGRPELRISNDRHYYVRGGYEEMWRLELAEAPERGGRLGEALALGDGHRLGGPDRRRVPGGDADLDGRPAAADQRGGPDARRALRHGRGGAAPLSRR